MTDSELCAPSVVVGIDGSRWAVDAALWATDEAVSRDVPLRMVCAIESSSTDPQRAAHELANAELAVRHAFTAVESTEKPVKIELEIVQRGPTRALLAASRSAAMICVGSTGLHHATRGRMGSTAAALAGSAHCPVAIVRRRADAKSSRPGAITAVLDGSTAVDKALERGVEEALLRGAALHVLTVQPSHPGNERENGQLTEMNPWVKAAIDRRLAQWQQRHPDLEIVTRVRHGNVLDYLEQNAGSIQLVIVDRDQSGTVSPLLGPAARTGLDKAGCTILVCDKQSRL